MKKAVATILFIVIVFLCAPWNNICNSTFINWDAAGYYQFLPAAFIYHDFNFSHWENQALLPYNFIDVGGFIYYGADKILVSKYSIGTAILQLPFFGLSCFAAVIFNYRLDGFSLPFQVGCYLSGIFYLLIGLWFSFLFIRKFFSETAAFISVLLIALGTNLFAFGLVNNDFSHLYGFCMIAIFIYSLFQLNQSQKYFDFILATIAFTMAVLVRSTNVIVIILAFFILFEKRAIIFHKINFHKIILSISLCFIPVFIQFSYWKYVTGNWFVVGYFENGEGFDFLHTHILSGLFSIKKGWFIHTPLATIAILFSYFLFRKSKLFFTASIFLLVVWSYVVFSWKVWYYDGGMSARPMVEMSSIVALFLAGAIDFISGRRIIKISSGVVIAFILYLNIIQTWMINNGIFPLVFVTKADYQNSVSGIKNFIEYKQILKSPHQIDQGKISSYTLLLDSSGITDQSCIGLTGNSSFRNIFVEKINESKLHKGNWIRVEGSGFYERKYPSFQNKCFVTFSVINNGISYQYQSCEMPLNTYDTTAIKSRKPLKFSFDFQLNKIINENDSLLIYLWNDSKICYHLNSARVLGIKLK